MFELIRQQTKGIHRSFGSFSIYSSTRSWKLSATSSTRESVALPSYPVPVELPAPLASKIVPGPEPPLLPTETLDGRILPDEPSTLPVPLVAAQKDGDRGRSSGGEVVTHPSRNLLKAHSSILLSGIWATLDVEVLQAEPAAAVAEHRQVAPGNSLKARIAVAAAAVAAVGCMLTCARYGYNVRCSSSRAPCPVGSIRAGSVPGKSLTTSAADATLTASSLGAPSLIRPSRPFQKRDPTVLTSLLVCASVSRGTGLAFQDSLSLGTHNLKRLRSFSCNA